MRITRELSRVSGGVREVVDQLFPVDESHAGFYRMLSGAWIAGGGFTGSETLDWVERGSHFIDPVTAVGVLATAAATSASVFLWTRARGSEEDFRAPDIF